MNIGINLTHKLSSGLESPLKRHDTIKYFILFELINDELEKLKKHPNIECSSTLW